MSNSDIIFQVQQIDGARNVTRSGQQQAEARQQRDAEIQEVQERKADHLVARVENEKASTAESKKEVRQGDSERQQIQQEMKLSLDQREGRGELVDIMI